MSAVKTTDKYIQGFPHKRLPTIDDEPTYITIKVAHKCLSANASTIKTTLGGGRHGYLPLTMPPAHYANFSHTVFVVPTNLGLTPMYPARATSAVIATLKARHDEQRCQWEEYIAVMQTLKKQVILAINNTYLQGIKDPTTEFHNVILLHMLEYLYDNYGKINEDSKSKHIEKMKEPYDVTTRIELFFQRIQDCIDFASAARSLLTTKQILDSNG